MELKQVVLRQLLARDGYQSGEALAAEAGVSRNAVWKAICRLRKEGYLIESSSRLGYRLSSENDCLSAEPVSKVLKGVARKCEITVFDTVDSTNTLLKQAAEEGAPEGTVFAAIQQTGGRGRLGRRFYSPPRTGLYFSLLLRPDQSATDALTLTALAAVAAARGIEVVTGCRVGIKWVNDLYWKDRKICGILTEGSVDLERSGLQWAVLGMGINLTSPEGGFPSDCAQKAGAVEETPVPGRRAALLGAVLNAFFEEYPRREEKRFLREYRNRSILIGRRVVPSDGSFPNGATAVGIDDGGGLILRGDDGEEKVLTSGEISIFWKGTFS